LHMFCCIFITSASIFASDCHIAIAGPNIKHALIFGPTIVDAIVAEITGRGATGPRSDAEAHGRGWATKGGGGATTGGGTLTDATGAGAPLPYDEDVLISTILMAYAASTLLFALCWFLLGRFRLTRIVQCVPSQHRTAPRQQHTAPGQQHTALGQQHTALGQHHTVPRQHVTVSTLRYMPAFVVSGFIASVGYMILMKVPYSLSHSPPNLRLT
jgi:MFS superfamily sulfate permease-like transporter